MFNRFQASEKLYLLIIVMSAVIIGTGVYGIFELKKMRNRTQTLYVDRVLPLQQLTRSRYSYSFNILATVQRLGAQAIPYSKGLEIINESEKMIRADWKAYMQTYLTPQESELTQHTIFLMRRSEIAVQKLQTILKKDDSGLTDKFLQQELYPTVNSVIYKLNQLIDLQVMVSGEVYEDSKNAYQTALTRFLMLIVLSLIFATTFSYFLIRNVRGLVSDLKANKEKYQSLLLQAGDPVFLLNKAGYFIEVNGSLCQLLGYTMDELVGKHLSMLFTTEQLAQQPLQFELLDKNRTQLLQKEWLKKDGSAVAVEINARVFDDIGYFAMARDITERISAEQSLRESEQKYRNIFENVQDVFYQTNLDGNVLDLSPSVMLHTGYAQEELIGSNITAMYYDPADRDRALNPNYALENSKGKGI